MQSWGLCEVVVGNPWTLQATRTLWTRQSLLPPKSLIVCRLDWRSRPPALSRRQDLPLNRMPKNVLYSCRFGSGVLGLRNAKSGSRGCIHPAAGSPLHGICSLEHFLGVWFRFLPSSYIRHHRLGPLGPFPPLSRQSCSAPAAPILPHILPIPPTSADSGHLPSFRIRFPYLRYRGYLLSEVAIRSQIYEASGWLSLSTAMGCCAFQFWLPVNGRGVGMPPAAQYARFASPEPQPCHPKTPGPVICTPSSSLWKTGVIHCRRQVDIALPRQPGVVSI